MTPVQAESAKLASVFKAPQMGKSNLYQLRLGHIGHSGLDTIVDIASVNKWELCRGCALGKQTRVSMTVPERAKNVLDVVHSDECGHMQTATVSENATLKYSSTTICYTAQCSCFAASRKCWTRLSSSPSLPRHRRVLASRSSAATTAASTCPTSVLRSVATEASYSSSRHRTRPSSTEWPSK